MKNYKVIVKATDRDIYLSFKADNFISENGLIKFYVEDTLIRVFSIYNLVDCEIT